MDIADRVEHALLYPASTADQVRQAVMAASKHHLAAVTVPPVWARFAVTAAVPSPVRVCVTVGYPMGTHTASAKGLEARLALEEGAAEVTIVPNLAAFKSGYREAFRQDVAYVVKQCRLAGPDALVKALLYIDLLGPEELNEAVRAIQASGVRFVLFGSYGAQPLPLAAVRLGLDSTEPGSRAGVMGEIRTWEEAQPLLDLGLARLVTPWGVDLVLEAEKR